MKALIAIILLFFATPTFAQVTGVTGTVKDANGVPYAGGSMKAQLVLAGAAVNGQPTVTVTGVQACRSSGFGSSPCQVPFQGTVGPFTLDSTGSFTQSLQDNALVTPAGTQWLISVTISPGVPPPLGTGPQACSATITITGVSQSVSSSFSSCPALAVAGISGGGSSSLTYQNITTNASTVVRSGSGMLGVIQVNNPGAGWGATIFDNTSCTGTKIGTISSFAALPSSTQNYYVTFSTGLCILTSGTTPGDLSVGFSSSPGTFSYSDITANGNTVIKAAPGRLQWIQINNPGAGWALTIYDNTSCSGTKIGTTASLSGLPSSLLKYQQTTTTGLCITTAGSVPGDITVVSL